MKVSDFKQSKYMKKEDFATPRLVTIASYIQANVAMQGAKPDYRCVMSFRELDKPVVMNTTKLDMIQAITGLEEMDEWIGHKIVLYHDPNIMFGPNRVGGISVRAPKAKKPISQMPTKELLNQPVEFDDEPEPQEPEPQSGVVDEDF